MILIGPSTNIEVAGRKGTLSYMGKSVVKFSATVDGDDLWSRHSSAPYSAHLA